MTQKRKALLALISTICLWGFLVIIARAVVVETSPYLLLFLRLLVAAVSFFPFFLFQKTWKKPHFKKLITICFGSTINLLFFMIGIQYTTASASQIIYAAIPILVLLFTHFVQKDRYPMRKTLGVVSGFVGLALIVYLSGIEKGETITGSLLGNILIIIAMLGWTSYLLSSKKISSYFSPTEIGSVSIITSFIISGFILFGDVLISGTTREITPKILWASLYMGFFGTFLTYILYQYAIKYLSPLTVSLSSYLQPIFTAFLAIIFLGEKLTLYFVAGSILVFSGIFLATTFELLKTTKLKLS